MQNCGKGTIYAEMKTLLKYTTETTNTDNIDTEMEEDNEFEEENGFEGENENELSDVSDAEMEERHQQQQPDQKKKKSILPPKQPIKEATRASNKNI
ncbi:hypothetical protein INT47_011519 [Mucor saturninus]|uniref:Uncharacterized protein n=1 Tax=Mucor saturninus TaxID=64648 RepID=A0A8H7QL83_9FUNG|nr:hypothetical protein INT47_011519 [Mucor saturninus]